MKLPRSRKPHVREQERGAPLVTKRERLRRRLLVGVTIVTGVAAAAEVVARYALGLGDPPLSMSDDAMEYRFKPGRYRRFGNEVTYNAYSMRSAEVVLAKSDPKELRVLVLGDSVVNGGSRADQSQIATERLRNRLADRLGRPVWVGNASAGSWGPANLLAYTRKFGWFDADVVVLVLSSHDAADAPTFEPLVGVHPDFPDRKPLLALSEAVGRYLPRLLGRGRDAGASAEAGSAADSAATRSSLQALGELLDDATRSGASVLVVQHWEREESQRGSNPGHGLIAAVARTRGVPTSDFKPAASDARSLYVDNIHLTPAGQERLADALQRVVLDSILPTSLKPAP